MEWYDPKHRNILLNNHFKKNMTRKQNINFPTWIIETAKILFVFYPMDTEHSLEAQCIEIMTSNILNVGSTTN